MTNQNNKLDEILDSLYCDAWFAGRVAEREQSGIRSVTPKFDEAKQAIQALYAPKPVENGELRETIDEVFEGLARYNCNAFTKDTLPNEIPPYAAKERVLALIRAEKLKLLAEVRERVVGEYETEYSSLDGDAGYWEKHGRNGMREKQITNLTKLEAEL